jgi:hypothetical protein
MSDENVQGRVKHESMGSLMFGMGDAVIVLDVAVAGFGDRGKKKKKKEKERMKDVLKRLKAKLGMMFGRQKHAQVVAIKVIAAVAPQTPEIVPVFPPSLPSSFTSTSTSTSSYSSISKPSFLHLNAFPLFSGTHTHHHHHHHQHYSSSPTPPQIAPLRPHSTLITRLAGTLLSSSSSSSNDEEDDSWSDIPSTPPLYIPLCTPHIASPSPSSPFSAIDTPCPPPKPQARDLGYCRPVPAPVYNLGVPTVDEREFSFERGAPDAFTVVQVPGAGRCGGGGLRRETRCLLSC